MMSTTESDPDASRGERGPAAGADTRPETRSGLVPPGSATVAGVVAGLSIAWIGASAGAFLVTVGGIALGAIVAASIAAVDAEQALRSVVGGPILLAGVAGAVGLPAYFALSGAPIAAGMTVAGVAIGAGVTRFRLEMIGDGAVSRAIGWVLRVTFVTGALAVLVAIIGLDIGQLVATVSAVGPLSVLVAPGSGTAVPLGFLVVAWLAFAGVWVAISSLPPAAVLPPSKRARYQSVRSRGLAIAGLLFGGMGTLLAVSYLLGIEAGIGAITGALAPIVGSTALRAGLLQLVLVGIVLAVLSGFFRSVGAALAYQRPAWIPSGLVIAVGGLLAAVVGSGQALETAATAGVVPDPILESLLPIVGPTAVGMLGLVAGLCGIAAVLALVPVVSGAGLLPSDTAGPRLVVCGLLVGTVAGAMGEATPLALFGGVVAAIVVWDVGEFGVGRTADVGVGPARRDGEFVHAGASLLVGGGGIVGTWVLYQFVTGIDGSGEGVLVVVLLGALVSIGAAVLLRG